MNPLRENVTTTVALQATGGGVAFVVNENCKLTTKMVLKNGDGRVLLLKCEKAGREYLIVNCILSAILFSFSQAFSANLFFMLLHPLAFIDAIRVP